MLKLSENALAALRRMYAAHAEEAVMDAKTEAAIDKWMLTGDPGEVEPLSERRFLAFERARAAEDDFRNSLHG